MILDLTKPALLGLLFFVQVSPPPLAPASQFRYRRVVMLSPGSAAAQACALLDADVFAHSAPSLKDLRLYSGSTEIPYATTLSEPLQQDSEEARILDLRAHSGHIFFDLEMPHRPYTLVTLDLAVRDYLATVTVSGSLSVNSRSATPLGTFTLFDLTSQRLSRVTDLPLSESTFPYLHLDLSLRPAPGSAVAPASLNIASIVRSATVPPSREAQSLYITTHSAAALQSGQDSVATFNVQTRVPVERVSFSLPPSYKGSFSRTVRIEAHGTAEGAASPQEQSNQSAASFGVENVTGSILSVHKKEAGRELSAEDLSIPVAIGSNMQQPAVVNVVLENGAEPPLPLSVELQMRQRRICFDTSRATAPLVLLYGDPSLEAPAASDVALTQAAANPRTAELGPETQNAGFAAALPSRKFNQHRPVLRWIALLGCVCIFALLVLRRSDRHRPHERD